MRVHNQIDITGANSTGELVVI